MNINRTTIIASVTVASALAAGALLGVADQTPESVELVLGVESPAQVDIADLDVETSARLPGTADRAEAPQRVPAPVDSAGSTPEPQPRPPAPNRPAPKPTNETADQPAREPTNDPTPVPADEPAEHAVPDDCDVVFYPDLFVSSTLDAKSITAAAQFTALPGETVAFGTPVQLPVELNNAVLTFSGLEHMTGRRVTPQDFDFGPGGLTQPFDVSLDFGGNFDDAQYRIDLTVNPVDQSTIEIVNVRFTHEHCDLGIRVPIDATDVTVGEIAG